MTNCHQVVVCAIAVLIAVMATSPLYAESHPFMAEYAKEEPVLRKQYFNNVRSKVSVVAYNDSKRDGSIYTRVVFTTITDGKSCRSNFDTHRLTDDKKQQGGVMWYGFEAYDLLKQPAPPYEMTGHKSSIEPSPMIDGMLSYTYIFVPFSLNGNFPFSSHVQSFTKQNDTKGYHFALESADRVRRGDYDAIRVVISFGRPVIRTTTYLDAGNHMAFREYEADGVFDIPTRTKLPIKQAGELTYAPGPDGYPIPKEYKEWFVHPDGRKVPKVTVTWEEFVRYTPAADDFDLEKQFGIKRLPPPAGLSEAMFAGSGRSWRWLYAVAAVLALVTGGLVVVARRRRSATAT